MAVEGETKGEAEGEAEGERVGMETWLYARRGQDKSNRDDDRAETILMSEK